MKKILLTLTSLALALAAVAEPAHPEAFEAVNPDGTTVTVNLRGDEFYHFTTTGDGYTVMKNAQGAYVYATRRNGRLEATTVVAHNPEARTAAELSLLQTLDKNLTDTEGVTRSKRARAQRDARMRIERSFDPSSFRGLVILVNFNDRKFSRSDANQFISRMLNEKNYNGYRNEDGTSNYYGNLFVGSVSDYFSDNTMGVFTPQFDVVGPIDVDASCKQSDSMGAFAEIFKQAVKLADSQVDYSKYDNDGDGYIDLLYFICAGYGSSYSGNNSEYLWPHAWYLFGENVSSMDGVWPARYACSVENFGWEDERYVSCADGIGTICHEFSHCLGLPDLYDTDYSGSGGESHHPGSWDLMAGGGHLLYSRRPVGYSLYDRYATGFASPTIIKSTGNYTLNPLGSSNQGYIIETPNAGEKFLLENRQRSNKWDAYAAGDGMIVARMDSTNTNTWNANTLNCDPSHNYYELLRAGGGTSGESDSDPFPGSAGVTYLAGDSDSEPNLLTWDEQVNDFFLDNIKNTNGVISFTVGKTTQPLSVIEDFEKMPVGATKNEQHVTGNFAMWTFTSCKVEEPGDDLCNGKHAVSMVPTCAVAMDNPSPYNVTRISFSVNNPTTVAAQFLLQYSEDNGASWSRAGDVMVAPAKSTTTLSYRPKFTSPVMYRIALSSGSKTKAVYLDDIILYYRDTYEPTEVYPLTLAGVQVNNLNAPFVTGENISGRASYDPETQTLTLDNATLNGGENKGLVSEVNDLKINVVGENHVNGTSTVGAYAIDLAGATTIGGTGTLYANGYRGVQMTGANATMLTVCDDVTLVAEGSQIGLCGYCKTLSKYREEYYSTLRVKDNATVKTLGGTSYTTLDWVDMLLEDGHAITRPDQAFFDESIHRIAVPYGEYNEMVGKWVYIEKVAVELVGDVNGDGNVNGADVTALYNVLLNGTPAAGKADVNEDGNVNGADVTALYNILLNQ